GGEGGAQARAGDDEVKEDEASISVATFVPTASSAVTPPDTSLARVAGAGSPTEATVASGSPQHQDHSAVSSPEPVREASEPQQQSPTESVEALVGRLSASLEAFEQGGGRGGGGGEETASDARVRPPPGLWTRLLPMWHAGEDGRRRMLAEAEADPSFRALLESTLATVDAALADEGEGTGGRRSRSRVWAEMAAAAQEAGAGVGGGGGSTALPEGPSSRETLEEAGGAGGTGSDGGVACS
ncbi:unnamed protein product, partial [Discosporangium mesarthrocarpum]